MYESLWWNKFYEEASKLVGDDPHYFKEKYGRFDCTYYGAKPGVQDLLMEIEFESEETCQRCAKRSKQIWTDWGWIEHWCWKCYLRLLCRRYWNKLKRKIKKMM